MDDNPTRVVRKASFKVEGIKGELDKCLQLNLFTPRQGAPLDRFDLSFDLNCGLHPLPDGLSIAARQCRVFMMPENCSFLRGTPYSHFLQEGRVETTQANEGSRERTWNVGGKVSAEGGFKAIIPWGNAGAEAKAGGEMQNRSKTSQGSKTTPAVPLISFEAGNTWVVGSEQGGDCRNDGGFLRGTYFNEEKDGDDYKPACLLKADSEAETVRVMVGVAVRPGDLWVIRDTDLENAKTARQTGDGMAERLAGMSVLKQIRETRSTEGDRVEAELPEEHVLIAFGAIEGKVEAGDE